jgi:hypothetical protein
MHKNVDIYAHLKSKFTFTPSSGEIQPLGQTTVSIKFTPTSVKSIKRVFEVSVEDGSEWYDIVKNFREISSNSQHCMCIFFF